MLLLIAPAIAVAVCIAIAEAMRPLQQLPVWVVIRICTDEDKMVDYWNTVDGEIELNMDVIDDPRGEAQEIHQYVITLCCVALCCVVLCCVVLVLICDIIDGPLLGFPCLPCPPLFDLLPLRLTVFLCSFALNCVAQGEQLADIRGAPAPTERVRNHSQGIGSNR